MCVREGREIGADSKKRALISAIKHQGTFDPNANIPVGLLIGCYFSSKTVAKKDCTSWKLVLTWKNQGSCHSVELM